MDTAPEWTDQFASPLDTRFPDYLGNRRVCETMPIQRIAELCGQHCNDLSAWARCFRIVALTPSQHQECQKVARISSERFKLLILKMWIRV